MRSSSDSRKTILRPQVQPRMYFGSETTCQSRDRCIGISSNLRHKQKRRRKSNASVGSWTTMGRMSVLSMLLALSTRQQHQALSFAPSATLESHYTYRTSINFRYYTDDEENANICSTSPTQRRAAAAAAPSSSNSGTGSATSAATKARQNTKIRTKNSEIEALFSTSSIPLLNNHNNFNRDNMPSWLRPNGYLAEGKLAALREIMRESSHLSHLEAEQVISAIREAGSNNLNMIAGAADFCLVLVETMEMGLATLIAAVFHYCECFTARQQSANTQPPSAFSHIDYWEMHGSDDDDDDGYDNARAIKIGQDAHQLVKDVGRIKRAEMAASQSIFMNKDQKPTPMDSFNMRKMLLSETRDWRALAIRCAACLYRLRGIYEHYDEEQRIDSPLKSKDPLAFQPKDIRVAREALSIHAPLASRLGMHRLKNEIEGAAFRILYPRQYEKVTSLTRQEKPCNDNEGEGCVIASINDGMRLILDKVTNEVQDLLRNDPYSARYIKNVKVTARIKEPYSLWKKMLKIKTDSILDVPDALALRVVLDAKKMTPDEDDEVTCAQERALCYCVRKMCTKKFKPLKDGRFKDYIQNPKPNGYQSLHYTAFTEFENENWPFEIQVRSGEMHQVAEFGLAAHWDYKLQEPGKTDAEPSHYAFKLDNSSDAYLRSVQQWHWERAHARGSWLTESSSSPMFGEKDEALAERLRERDEHLAPYLKALKKDQSNLSREHVFVFLSCQESDDATKSHILELPAGACVLDALRESERTLGISTNRILEKKVVHNGSTASLTQKLNNGDILIIPSAKESESSSSDGPSVPTPVSM